MRRITNYLKSIQENKGMNDLHAEIIKFFKANPNPTDEAVHAFAKKLGVDEHELERHIYMLLSSAIAGKKLQTENIEPKSYSEKGFDINIEKETLANKNFRKVLFTGHHHQLVLMSIEDDIGVEVHNEGDQFIRVEGGTGEAIINGRKFPVSDGIAFIIPQGAEHNVVNTGNEPLKLYAVYSWPNHPDKVVNKTKPNESEEE
jgi:mannose-6-phosphate isomerase-like protein (cupin superfamily)